MPLIVGPDAFGHFLGNLPEEWHDDFRLFIHHALHHIEGPRYDVEHLQVHLTAHQQHVTAYCYVANTIDKVALPFDWYVQHVYLGAQEAALPESYVQSIKNQASVEDLNHERRQHEMQIHTKEQ